MGKNSIMKMLEGRKDDVTKTVQGVVFGASDFAPSVRSLLEKNGNKNIVEMIVGRTPVASGITKAINIVSQGGFQKNQDELQYERLFHLFVNLRLEGNVKIRLEKNEVITMTDGWTKEEEGQYQPITINKQVTLGELVMNAKRRAGDKFFLYDSASNNCQDFILNLLQSNGLGTEQDYAFIKQDTESLFKGLDKTRFIAKAVTDFGARFNIATKGGKIISPNNIMPKKLIKGSPEAKAFMASIRAKRGGAVESFNGGDKALNNGLTKNEIENLKSKSGGGLKKKTNMVIDEMYGGKVSKNLKENAGANTSKLLDALVQKAVEKLKIKGGAVSEDLKENAGANTEKLLDALVAKTIEKLNIKGGAVSESLKENAGDNTEILMDGLTKKAIEKLKLKGGKMVSNIGDMSGYGVTIHQHHHHHYGSGLDTGMGLKAGEGVNRLNKAKRWTGYLGDTYQSVAKAVKPVAQPILQAGTEAAVDQINPVTPQDYFEYYMM